MDEHLGRSHTPAVAIASVGHFKATTSEGWTYTVDITIYPVSKVPPTTGCNPPTVPNGEDNVKFVLQVTNTSDQPGPFPFITQQLNDVPDYTSKATPDIFQDVNGTCRSTRSWISLRIARES